MTVVLSALFAGLVAVLVTLAIERLGGEKGGIVGTLPSTIVPASYGLFVAAESEDAFAAAIATTPVGMLANALFLLAWREIPDRLPTTTRRARFALTLALSLSLWALAALVVTTTLRALFARGTSPLVVALAATATIFVVGLAASRKRVATTGAARRAPAHVLVARGVMAAVAVGAAVALAKVGAPVIAGVAAVFPAIFLTTMVALWLSHGEDVPRSAVGALMLGSTSVAAYSVFALVVFPRSGPALGAPLCFALSALLVTWPLHRATRRRADAR